MLVRVVTVRYAAYPGTYLAEGDSECLRIPTRISERSLTWCDVASTLYAHTVVYVLVYKDKCRINNY